jgi:hypothetical protein
MCKNLTIPTLHKSITETKAKFLVDFNITTMILFYIWEYEMANPVVKSYINTTLNAGLLKSIKVLAAQKGMRLNQLLEEALEDLLKKYEAKKKTHLNQ